MKVTAFNGSPRAEGNTAALLRHLCEELNREGVDTEVVQVGGKRIHGCMACFKCFDNLDRHCSVTNDIVNPCIDKMLASDGIVLASPTYFANITAEMKALIDRAGMTAKANDEMFRRKVGAAVVAVRRAGAIHAFNSMNHFFLISQMIVPGSSYWNLGIGLEPGDVNRDEEGIRTMKTLGSNMAWALKKLFG